MTIENRSEIGELGLVEEPHIKIGMAELYTQFLRLAEVNQRLDAKLDSALSSQTIRMEMAAEKIHDVEKDVSSVSDRLRIMELQPVVTPKAMWTGVGVIIGGVSVAIAVVGLVVK